MADKQRNADRTVRDAQGRRNPGPPDNKQQQRENQKKMGVGEDHRTKTMRDKHRGTFP